MLSDAIMTELPMRKTTFDKTLSRLSAEIRCTSEISLLMREITSPSFAFAQKRGESDRLPLVERHAHIEQHQRRDSARDG